MNSLGPNSPGASPGAGVYTALTVTFSSVHKHKSDDVSYFNVHLLTRMLTV